MICSKRPRGLFTPTSPLMSLTCLALFAVLTAVTECQMEPDPGSQSSLLRQIGALESKLLNLMEKVRVLEEAKSTNVETASKRGLFSSPYTQRQLRNRIYLPPRNSQIYSDSPVAMYVSLASATNVPANGLVPYSQMYTSAGLGTNPMPETATFVSPRDCYYLVSIAVLAQGDSLAVLQLQRNKRNVFKATSDTRNKTYTQGGGSVILQMKVGDTLAVRSYYDTVLKGDDTNTFSVYCLNDFVTH